MSLQIKKLCKTSKTYHHHTLYHRIMQYTRIILDEYVNLFEKQMQEIFKDCYLNLNRFEFK